MKYTVLGIMSGTSLDGIDLALCQFSKTKKWNYKIIAAETIPYDEEWKQTLIDLPSLPANTLALNHALYGYYLGTLAKKFSILNSQFSIDFISSHGHTIFHRPSLNYTFQLGSGADIAAASGLPVVCNFRASDVALGGQGAPLVPIGDKLLFGEYDYCLNLGGIANVSFREKGKVIAGDICPCNLVLNHLARQAGKQYDKGGKLAEQGGLSLELLHALRALPFNEKPFPKSLGLEDVQQDYLPLIDSFKIPIEDKLITYCIYVGIVLLSSLKRDKKRSIDDQLKLNSKKTMLVTGGSAHNKILLETLRNLSGFQFHTPDGIVDFKEALIFAFLGVLRWRNEKNILRSYTGATRDSVAGAIYN